MIDGVGVAGGGGDGDAEEVAEPSDVAAGGVGFVEDAVLAQGLAAAGKVEGQPEPSISDAGLVLMALRKLMNRCGLVVVGHRCWR